MQELQSRLGERARWFRVGVVSATVITPLVSRWQTLRAAERTRALWNASRAGTAWPRRRHQATPELPPLARKSNLSTGLWLAGVGVGLVAAGTAAYFLARRRMAAREEEPLELPLATQNGADGAMGTVETIEMERGAMFAAPPGVQPSRRADDVQRPRPPRPAPRTTEPEGGATSGRDFVDLEATGASTTLPGGAPAGVTEPDKAPFIGDIRSLVYHEANDENLPAESNRVYFASREEAESAGYHVDRNEAPTGETTP